MNRAGRRPYLGAGLALLEGLATAVGVSEYRRYCQRPTSPPRAVRIPLLLAGTVVVAGLVLTWMLLR